MTPSTAVLPYVAPPLPASTVSSAVASVNTALANAKPDDSFSCLAFVKPDRLPIVEAEGIKLAEAIIKDTSIGVTYGNDALEDGAALVKRLLSEEKPVALPELDTRMRKLRQELRAFQGNVASSDPQVQEFFGRLVDWFTKVIHLGRGSWDLMRDHAKTLDRHLDDLESLLAQNQRDLIQAIAQYDVYYDSNEQKILKIAEVIAIMEMAARHAAKLASEVVIKPGDPTDRGQEQKNRLEKISHDLVVRVSNFQATFIMDCGTSPDIRQSRDLDVTMATKLSDLQRQTLPQLRGVVWRWMKQEKAKIYAQQGQAIADFANDINQMYARSSVDSARIAAQFNESTILTSASILAMANAIDQVADVVVQAMQAGAQQRSENRVAFKQALQIIEGSGGKVNAQVAREALGVIAGMHDSISDTPALTK